mgnify:CR=1 FL=1
MSSLGDKPAGPRYWRSLEDLADTGEFRRFLEAEFPALAPELTEPPSRRRFLQLMAASAALAGFAGCRWPREEIAPFAVQPPGRSPGRPVPYATAMPLGGSAQGLLVTSYDGRPIKIEGNPLHPLNAGAADAFAQASLLELYDPDRSRQPLERETAGGPQVPREWEDFAAFAKTHFAALREGRGAGFFILSEEFSSPTAQDLRTRLLNALPLARWFEYEPFSRDHERAGTRMLFGRPHRPQLALDRAEVIVSFDDDLLGGHPAALKHARDFVAGRRVGPDGRRLDGHGPMNRLWVVETGVTITGAAADRRLAVSAERLGRLLAALARRLAEKGLACPAGAETWMAALPRDEAAPHTGFIESLADDLLAHRGRSVLSVGPAQPPAVHALVHLLNIALGNVGVAVGYSPDSPRPSLVGMMEDLTRLLQAGRGETLLILGGNPVFDAPADLDFSAALARVPTSLHLSLYNNETSRACRWHLPRAHYLEAWGDARAWDGTMSIIQPLIEPLHGGRSEIELLAEILGEEDRRGHTLVRRTFGILHDTGVDREGLWRRSLHDGVVPQTAWPAASPPIQPDSTAWEAFWQKTPPAREAGAVEVVFVPDPHAHDGRFANNGWLQECPAAITKLTWDNAAAIAPATAERLRVRSGDVVRLSAGGRSLEIPVFILPGQPPEVLTIPVGQGRTAAGRVGDGVGVNAYVLRTTAAMGFLGGVRVEPTGRRHELATTQDHQAMASAIGRQATAKRVPILVREATIGHYRAHPEFARHAVHHPPLVSLWEETTPQEGCSRWAMAIDLNACIGCGACVVACQAENNIPVVGREEVANGREMHWLRIDRYFTGDPAAPRIAFQPVTCHHCENAPCEQVCPVAATVHSHEGLNDMVYNRCIGTRYCSNNCPYKVRRFNWFNNHRRRADVEKLAFNPEVTVRGRGVMEKCTFCVQRISAVRIAARNDGRSIRDGEIVPACAQTCPTKAIVFGDLGDPRSAVAKAFASERAYALLAELNVKPRTAYLARLTNPPGEA